VAVEEAASVATVAAAVETAAAATAAVPAPPVVYSNFTRPTQAIEFNEDAFKVVDRNGNQRSDAAARMGKSRAVNMIVKCILGDYFSTRHTPEQLVLALHAASKDARVRTLFKVLD